MPWLKLMQGLADGVRVILADDFEVTITCDTIDRLRGRKWKYKGKELFYVDYHIYEDGAIAFIIGDEPLGENWWAII